MTEHTRRIFREAGAVLRTAFLVALTAALFIAGFAILSSAVIPRAHPQTVERVVLLHPQSHAELGEIENGGTLDLNALGTAFPVAVAVTSGPVDQVLWRLVDVARETVRHSQSSREPWSMCGHVALRRIQYFRCGWLSRSGPRLLGAAPVRHAPYERFPPLTLSFEVVAYDYGTPGTVTPGTVTPGAVTPGAVTPGAGDTHGPPRNLRCEGSQADCEFWREHHHDDNYDPVTGNRCHAGVAETTVRQEYSVSDGAGESRGVTLVYECP